MRESSPPFRKTRWKRLNVRMLDGALLQMTYEFTGLALTRSRLAFLPSPDLSEFQNNPDVYMEDVLFAEVVNRQVVAVPVRFDFDSRDGVASDILHPCSHVTLGQYKNCRIAATSPLTPGVFVEFILRSFYNTATNELSKRLPGLRHRFDRTITDQEVTLVHFAVPS
ncbi:DUF2290 domain-containing protein [Parafrankia colletiae]|uniref:DUF2290 domain-containing protein n=1 Tax=Parafrankia colletiae TaxID=573497 RepID=UPI00210FA7C2|nr:DUF2290 domain-containing protein [Parafrankia colletiae]